MIEPLSEKAQEARKKLQKWLDMTDPKVKKVPAQVDAHEIHRHLPRNAG